MAFRCMVYDADATMVYDPDATLEDANHGQTVEDANSGQTVEDAPGAFVEIRKTRNPLLRREQGLFVCAT